MLDVRLVHDLEELAHGVAAVRDFPRESLGDGRCDASCLLARLLRRRRKRRRKPLEEDGPRHVAAHRHVDGIFFQLPGTVPHPVAVLGDDHLGAHVVDGVAEDVGSLGPEHEVVRGTDKGRRELGDQPHDIRGHVDDDHVPRRNSHVDQDVRQAVGLPPDLPVGERLHVHVLPVLLVLADVDHPTLVQKSLRIELVEDRPGGVDLSVFEAADHREAAQIERDRRPHAPRVRVDHVELELLGICEPGAADDAPPEMGLHQRPEDTQLVGDPVVRPLGVAKIDAEVDCPGGVALGRQRPSLLPAVVDSPWKDVLDRLVEERRVFREPAARGNRRSRDRCPESLGIRENDTVQVAVELPGDEALRNTQYALQVGETRGHLLGELELHGTGLILTVKTVLGEGVDEELGQPHGLGRGRSHRGQGFLREEVPLRRGPLQAGKDVPQVAPVGLPEPEVSVDLLRELANLLPEDIGRAAHLLQEGLDPTAVEGTFCLPELRDKVRGVVTRVPLGQAQTNGLFPAHGGGCQTEVPGRGGAHAARKEPGGAVSGDKTDLRLREPNSRRRVGDQEVRSRRQPQGRPGAQAADNADRRDAKTPDFVAHGLLIREKPEHLRPGGGVQEMTHHFGEIRTCREILPPCEDQCANRGVPSHLVDGLQEAGDVGRPRKVPPVRALEPDDRNAVLPDAQLHEARPGPSRGTVVFLRNFPARTAQDLPSGFPHVRVMRCCRWIRSLRGASWTTTASETPTAGISFGAVSVPSTEYQKRFYAHKIPSGPRWIPPNVNVSR